jgi:hypothetical protein
MRALSPLPVLTAGRQSEGLIPSPRSHGERVRVRGGGIAGRWDLKGHAVESALKSAWHRRVVVSDDLSNTFRDVRDAPTHMSRAGKVAGHTARHFAAQVLSIGAMISFAGGLGLTALALYLK